MYRHILLATDGSDCALKAAKAAAQIAVAGRSAVTLVFVQPVVATAIGVAVVPVTEELVQMQERTSKDAYQRVIDKTRPPFDEKKIKFDCIQGQGWPGDVITGAAKKCGADLIVIGHRGLSTLQSIFLGSTSERVVHTAGCSVLVVR